MKTVSHLCELLFLRKVDRLKLVQQAYISQISIRRTGHQIACALHFWVILAAVESNFVWCHCMTTPFPQKSRHCLALLKKPHLDRVIVFTCRDQDWFARQKTQRVELSARVGRFHLTPNLLFIQVPQDYGSAVLGTRCQKREAQSRICQECQRTYGSFLLLESEKCLIVE